MSRFKFATKFLLPMLALTTLLQGLPTASAQTPRRTRRESTANRKARIQREIQETYSHRFEIAGGGGGLRFRSGQYLQKNNEVTFWMNGTYLLRPKLGVLVDVHGAYGKAKVGNTIYNIANPQISEYTFTGGPSYRFYERQKTAIGVFGTGGLGLSKFDAGSKGLPSSAIGVWNSGLAPVFTAGVNFDFNFYPNLAARVTPTYIGTFFGSTLENNVGFNVGVVYRFGTVR